MDEDGFDGTDDGNFIDHWSDEEIEDAIGYIDNLVTHPGYRLLTDELEVQQKSLMVMLVSQEDMPSIYRMQGKAQALGQALATAKWLKDLYKTELGRRAERRAQEEQDRIRRDAV